MLQILLARLCRNDKGAAALEYGLLAAMIAIACLAAWTFLGDQLSAEFENISYAL